MADLNFGINSGLVEELYGQYLDNPESVDPSWRRFFDERVGASRRNGGHAALYAANGKNGAHAPEISALVEQSFTPVALLSIAPEGSLFPAADGSEHAPLPVADGDAALHARVYQLLNAYRVRGHLYADINPLVPAPTSHPELALENFGLSASALARSVPTIDFPGAPTMLLGELVEKLRETYCRSIGVEFTHIEDPVARRWLRERMEATKNRLELGKDQQLRILSKLTQAEVFEQFIHGSYGAGTKRFSLEGGESMMPFVDLLIERGAENGVEEVVLGMAHRGRLNVLVNIMGKSLEEIFAAFEDSDAEANLGRGDVKYHLGYSTDRKTQSGKDVHLTLTFNPSHLEFVNPVVEGRVRAKQDRRQGATGSLLPLSEDAMNRVLPLLIHGDAAFIGQGIVPETLNLCNLPGYRTGGTVHLIINNQVGFTTDPEDSRSTRYASDITRMLKVPVFHVNGEDPEAVAQVALLAMDYRQKFKQDVVIDVYCYRKYGHNEGDEPRYTQPMMYRVIDKKPTVRRMYVDHLKRLGHVTEAIAEEIAHNEKARLEGAFRTVKQQGCVVGKYTLGGVWAPFKGGAAIDTPEVPTKVSRERLCALSEALVTMPADFKAHPKVLPVLRHRHEKLTKNEPFDWGAAEALAYASLLEEGFSVRMSGQDVQRGTFSHRHAVLHDIETGAIYSPFEAIARGKARFDPYNSPLSEAGVLGFEFGYSLDYPDSLVIWEAQFGDFLNGAQVIVDQFITSTEDKWHRLSGVTLFLPHGYEGQGPEHSSARMERFLQNSAEDNIQVCNLTTPAQLFHVLRRQVIRPWRKPLVIMTPKSLLRVAATSSGPHRPVSTLDDLADGRFHPILEDTSGATQVRKVLLCSGKVYYDLALEREAKGHHDVAILRLEQLYPLGDEVKSALAKYPAGTPLVWVQEEPKNYGGWYFANARLPEHLEGRMPLSCVARASSASPATGSKAAHTIEQAALLREAFS
jgi:2-oxoglutarate dehydrogenase E1 component